MPYIKKDERYEFNTVLDCLPSMATKGQLEFCIFKLMRMYMCGREYTYSNLHDVAYAAEHCADEFRRRFLDNREDFTRMINGDVE
jgi:hypothetical protein